ncbi:ParB N-terminal domain-containing protein [Ruegeria sp. HKCCD7318]|uniref:ParB N-terminal domain-containing protein n=1 Tax=Ruegeria sp. HKCCD7318 TaxID=2683014 RepID=UPI0014929218|nr:ParB N-terminal domain-containing protein [Ruegeria sp. HKCCD7318]NOE36252.1 ParB N-terminal domain-containing protein [Ruegeria sp. HKCCD7318]
MATKKKRDVATNLMNSVKASSVTGTDVKSKQPTRKPSTTPGIQLIERTYNAVREIDPDLIDDSPHADRLELFTIVKSAEALTEDQDVDLQDGSRERLVDSILTHGQKVPILVRNSLKEKGRYEVIFGRRRLAAIRYIRSNPRPGEEGEKDKNLKIRANVETKDPLTSDAEFDNQVLVTQALENAARKNLSAYEKARFANLIHSTGVEKQEVARMMNLSASNLSNLLKITKMVPDSLGDMIGAASGCGRPKWEALATALEEKALSVREATKLLGDMEATSSSDDRLKALLAEIKRRAEHKSKTEVRELGGIAKVQKGPSGLKLTVNETKETAGFADWLDTNIEKILEESLKRFQAENPGES